MPPHGIEPMLQMEGITKSFPGVIANDNVNLRIDKGEVRGLLGENGAGKTTLMNILYGLHQPDRGDIYIGGRKVRISSPREANDLGVGMVHQHFMLVENLSALDNVLLSLRARHPPLLEAAETRARFVELADEYHLDIDPSTPVWQMSVGDQQWLEILKLLIQDVQLVILDEPTAVLAPAQIQRLFGTIRRFSDEGRTVIFISHKLAEVKQVTDRVTVLRDGQVIGTLETSEASSAQLAEMMIGRPVSISRRSRSRIDTEGNALLIKDLRCTNDRGVEALKGLSLIVHSGEIVGIAGVDGNGQRELAECIAGLRSPTDGILLIRGQPAKRAKQDPKLLGFIPEDRRKTGLVIDFTVAENLILRKYKREPYMNRGILQWDEISKESERLIDEFDIRTPGPQVVARFLSGGNQQKVVVARELDSKPALIVASQPTRGLDLGAVEGVHDTILRERERGAGILFISTELSEVLAISDRIIVLFKGEIMGEVDGEAADARTIGEMMMGHVAPDDLPRRSDGNLS